MPEKWYTEPGNTGTVTVCWRNDGWYVSSSDTDRDIKCILKGTDISENSETHQVEGTVSRYMIGTDGGSDYLHLDVEESETAESTTSTVNRADATDPSSSNDDSSDSIDLAEFSGSGDYVTVAAVVDSVFWISKDEPNTPDLKGKLVDDSVKEGVIFVVEDGVNHPYLEEGRRFKFSGVKDYYYKKKGEVQVKVTSYTDFTDLGKPHSTSNPDSGDGSSGGNLHEIAEEKIGDHEFTASQETEDSAVGKAKKRARAENRDPAIDPRFQGDE